MQWRATFDGLQNNPDKRIMKVLRMSFEGLQPREKEIFLHVACFFEGEREDYVRRILHACGLQPNIGIPLIAEKSLITIRNHVICMHKMLQELGKQIVQGQHLDEPRFWSRLWLYRDFRHVVMTKTVTYLSLLKQHLHLFHSKETSVSSIQTLSFFFYTRLCYSTQVTFCNLIYLIQIIYSLL
jgi:hypothetical protein